MPGFPRSTGDEMSQLVEYLRTQRGLLGYATFGVTDEQSRLTPTASELSLAGIVSHLTGVERFWCAIAKADAKPFDPGNMDNGFSLGGNVKLSSLLDQYKSAAEETDEALSRQACDHEVPVPKDVPWFPKDASTWTLRWIALHLIEETARHAGHADIIRESIDGATWLPLLAAADNVDFGPWIKPWTRKVAAGTPG